MNNAGKAGLKAGAISWSSAGFHGVHMSFL